MPIKKLLLLEPFTALPQTSGGRTRIFHTIEELKAHFDLTVWSFFANNQEHSLQEGWLKKMNLPSQHFLTQKKKFFSFLSTGQPYWFSDWWSRDLIEILKKKSSEFNTIQVEFSQLLYLVKYLSKENYKVFVAHDIASFSFWRRLQSEKNLIKKFLHFWRFLEVYLYERRYLPLFDLVIAMSEEDKSNLKKLFHLQNIAVIENGIDKIDFLAERKKDDFINLGLIGSFAHPPNLEAFCFCCEQILPILEKNQIKYKFYLAGENDQAIVQEVLANSALKDPASIINLGFVANAKDFYQKIDLLIAPLFAGSGTRIKILQSLSFARPILTTKIGAEGLKISSPLLQIISSENEKNPDIWLQMIRDIYKFKMSENDLTNLNKKLSNLTWQAVMKKSLSLL